MVLPRFLRLLSGAHMPTLGLGTFQAKMGVVQAAVDCALHVGYRHIDTAVFYGNEHDIGEVLEQNLKDKILKRKDLFVTTKIPPVYMDQDDIEPCVEESLTRLRLNYIDMVLIHQPWGLKNHEDGNLKPLNKDGELDLYHHDLVKSWKAMEKLVQSGKVKNIGLSNVTAGQIDRIWTEAGIKPSNVQLECHAYLQQQALRTFCAQRGIIVTGYSPLGAPNRPDSSGPAGCPVLLNDPIIHQIAAEHNCTPGQVLLNFVLRLGVIPLPKSANPSRIKENMDFYKVDLSDKNRDQLMSINKNFKYFTFPGRQKHPEFFHGEPY